MDCAGQLGKRVQAYNLLRLLRNTATGAWTPKDVPPTTANQGLLLPLRPGATFTFVDRDLIYGTSDPDTLTITSYRFSTNASTRAVADVSATLPTCRQVCPPMQDFLRFISNDFLVDNDGPVHA